jgi:hypothetical protein
MGRAFDEDPNQADREVVLSHRLWQRRFGGDPNIVGKTIRFNATSTTDRVVVGVMPETPFADIELGWGDVWARMNVSAEAFRTTPARARYMRVIGRLKPGVTVEQA